MLHHRISLLFTLALITSLAASCAEPDPASMQPPANAWGPCMSDADCDDGFLCNLVGMCMQEHDASPFECDGDCGAASAAPFGEVVATYRGVPAYSNGPTTDCHACAEGQALGLSCGYRCNGFYSTETPYGLAYQCIEYVRRFYAEVYGDSKVAYSRGDANAYAGDMLIPLGLTEHLNGQTSTMPRPDDILVFFGGSAGHVAIVTKVEAETQRVWFIQQNVPNLGEMSTTYQVNGGQVLLNPAPSPLSGHPIHAWLRNPQYTLPCHEGLTCPEGYVCTDGTCEEAECPNPAASTGVMATPQDGSAQGGEFTVSGSVSDDNGVAKVTVAVDTLEDCKFSELSSDPTTVNYSFGIEVDPASCGLSPGSHTLGLWMQDGCGLATLVDDITFEYVESSPGECPVGTACCEPSGDHTPAGSNGAQCFGECSACDGTGGCTPRPPGTQCASGDGSCDGAGACDVPTCGDGAQTVDPGEQCDGSNLDGQSCVSLGFDGGSLSCTSSCTFNTSSCTQEPVCAATDYWSPTSDSHTDPTGLQSNQSINVSIEVEVRQTGSGLEARVCKPGDTFQENVAFYVHDDASGNAEAQSANLATAGNQCSPWLGLSNDNGYLEGDLFSGAWQLVSPYYVADDWSWPTNGCVVNGTPWGTCWNGSGINLTRTCEGL